MTKAAILLLLRCLAGEQHICTEAVAAVDKDPQLAIYAELGRQELRK